MSYLPPGAGFGGTTPSSVQQFASEYGLSPFQIPNSADTGYSGASPTGQGDVYVGPDGQVYPVSKPGQEVPGTPSLGSYQSYSAQNPSAGGQAAGFASQVNPTQPQLAAFAPQPYQAFGNIPTITPTQVDTSQMPGALQGFEQANATALQPMFDQQNESLLSNLGSRGIINSGAATYLNNQLAGQQAGALAGADAPLIQQQAGAWNQAQSQNAQAGNTASAYNADLYNQAVTGNMNNYNNYQNTLFNAGNQYAGGLMGGFAGTYGGPNAAPLGTLGQTPGSVGAASQAGFQSVQPAGGFAQGINSIQNAFNTPKQPNGFASDPGQVDSSSFSGGSY